MKALPGITTHAADIADSHCPKQSRKWLVWGKDVLDRLSPLSHPVGYIIAGHGLYAWGATMATGPNGYRSPRSVD